MSSDIAFEREIEDVRQATMGYFRSEIQTITDSTEFDAQSIVADLLRSIEEFTQEGSGWTLHLIKRLVLHIGQYAPLAGSSFVETPDFIRKKHCIVNVKNNDHLCFAYAILAHIFPVDMNHKPNELRHYERMLSSLNFSGINFPVKITDIRAFEKNNLDISVTVFECRNDTHDIGPLYISKYRNRKHNVKLLLLKDPKDPAKFHYTTIRNISALVAHRTKHCSKTFVCSFCLHPFSKEKHFLSHLPDCMTHKPQKTIFPDPDNKKECTLEFRKTYKTEKMPFIIYYDMESLLVPRNGEKEVSEHIPCGICSYTVSIFPEHQSAPVIFTGPDCMQKFFDHLMLEERRISQILGRNVSMLPLTDEEKEKYKNVKTCSRCHKDFTAKNPRVRHHCHVTARFLECICSNCNLACKPRKNNGKKENKNEPDIFYIPICAHNASNYDVHHILRYFDKRLTEVTTKKGKTAYKNVNVITKTSEKFISFSILNKRFIDSFQFMGASLDSLVQNLIASSEDDLFSKFQHTSKHVGRDREYFQKGVYCYEYMDSFSRFEETELPPKEAFYSRLNEHEISDEEYARALEMWVKFECKTMQDYHNAYLLLDTVLLADVFEEFRKLGLSTYGLDPAHYLTAPGYAWDACLKLTGVKLDLITDPELYLAVENGIRGGISTINTRYAKANNPYMESGEYDPTEPHSYIALLDANNLYGHSLASHLPTGNFSFLSPEEWSKIDFSTVPDDSSRGYFVEADIRYPEHLHDRHNSYPLAPEKLLIRPEMLSDYSKSFDRKGPIMEKLVPNLYDKVRYMTHYRNLKLYLELGMEITKIHRVIAFDQSAWMKKYIDLNTELRKKAKTDFEKNFYKLLINSVFGKTLENVRCYRKSKLICNPSSAKKLLCKQNLSGYKMINSDLVLFDTFSEKVLLNKPIYIGFTVLDISKILMYDFHYKVMLPKYGDNLKFLFTDTDSLCYKIITDDLPKDLMDLKDDYLDTSNYPTNHPLFSTKNARVYGYFKNEIANGDEPIEFVGLKSKNYSLLVSRKNSNTKMTAKGIKRGYVKKNLRHEQYLNTIREKTITRAKFLSINSINHVIKTVINDKICLSAYDDKRYIADDGISTLSYGHYSIVNK